MKLLMVASALLSGLLTVEPCTTPSGGTGTCVVINKCQSLFQLIRAPSRTTAELTLLRDSKCGFEGDVPMVCCPDAVVCVTPSGEQGKCASRQSCPNLCKNCEVKRCSGADRVCCPLAAKDVKVGSCASNLSAYPPHQNSGCCGRDSTQGNKITVGGTYTELDQYPWIALIEYQQGQQIKTFCGGVLISGKYVLTAAHCVSGAILERGTPVSVRLGEYDTSTNQDCKEAAGGGLDCNDEPLSLPIERIIAHPEYDAGIRRHDIALIRTKQFAPWTDFIRPICLPTVDDTLAPPPGFRMYVAGWGQINSTHLQSAIKVHVDVPFVNHEKCQKIYSEPKRTVALGSGQLCAGGEKDKDSCRGDSGGPLMYEREKTFDVIGLVSFGTKKCGSENVPAIYTKVHKYSDWIYSNIIA